MRPALKYVLLALAGIIVLYLAVTWVIDALRSDESRIRLVFREVAEYAQKSDAGAVLEYLDPEYSDPQGFTAPDVRRIIYAYFIRSESVEVELEPVGILPVPEGIEVEGDEVDVIVRARALIHMPGGETLTFADADLSGEHFVVRLRRYKSYFRGKSVRPAEPEEVPEE